MCHLPYIVFTVFLVKALFCQAILANSLVNGFPSNNMANNLRTNVQNNMAYANGVTNIAANNMANVIPNVIPDHPIPSTMLTNTNSLVGNIAASNAGSAGIDLDSLLLGGAPISGVSPAGFGDVAVAGEMPVEGSTAVTGNVPVIGFVTFEGYLPAGGMVSLANNCGSNGEVPY